KNSPKKLYYRLLSEFMLQQTQVKTVIPYFKKFTKKYKTLKSFSKSSEKKTLKLWEGLGYYRRARNLLAASKILVIKYNSKLPRSFKEIKNLPGVGDYTANALLGLVQNKPVIAIDGNVKRVFSRIINIKENKINFDQFIEINKKKLFNSKRNSDFVEALMEFGALVCKPKDPICGICNLNKNCKYFNSSRKIKVTKYKMIKNKYYDVFCYVNKKKQIALTKKNNLGFLNQFSLPEIREAKNNIRNRDWKFLKRYKNSISNKKLNINLYYKFSNKIPPSFIWHSMEKNKEFIPAFTKKYLNKLQLYFNEKKNSDYWSRNCRIDFSEFN
ncbi:hypothetical protein IDH12_05255, partial [Pelagibacterales bacterium SAG-MED29]|nr:hypothetical protein [Pelagibacterales bacterium SAG-MED29]